jgi:peroxiredoxin Q/BCP
MKLLLPLVLASLLLPAGARADQEVPAVGTRAPDFTLNSQDGKPVTLKKLQGKWIVLYFYPKDFTKGCTIEAHNFQEDLSKFKKKKALILGVSVQNHDSHKSFCEKERLNFKLLADVDHSVSGAYGSLMDYHGEALSARNTFIIGPEGLIRKEFIKVDPAEHSREVLDALAELQKK